MESDDIPSLISRSATSSSSSVTVTATANGNGNGNGRVVGRAISSIPNVERRLSLVADNDPLLFRLHHILYAPSSQPLVYTILTITHHTMSSHCTYIDACIFDDIH
jgi:hypothetical protein